MSATTTNGAPGAGRPATGAPARSRDPMQEALFEDETTVADARAYLRRRWLEGADCPVCRQRVQVYRRTITSAMALGLLAVYRIEQKRRAAGGVRSRTGADLFGTAGGAVDTAVHVEDALRAEGLRLPSSARSDFAKLRYWGLIERPNTRRPDGSARTGYWTLTERGRRFCRGEVRVPAAVYLYNGSPVSPAALGVSDDAAPVSIRDALGTRFNYDELMRGAALAAAENAPEAGLPAEAGRRVAA